MKWFEEVNSNSDIVISTRVRLARNLRSYEFSHKITNAQKLELNKKVQKALEIANLGNNSFEFIEFDKLQSIGRAALVEKHLVSRGFMESPKNKMLALSADNSISIMVNEEDHLRIQVLCSGMEPAKAFELCNRIDDLLDEQLDFAFDNELGYLTSCPTNLGTGLRASLMMHLPALTRNQSISALSKTVSRMGLTIRGTYGEGSEAEGAIYQLSNQVTLGLSEKEAIDNLTNVATQVITAEKEARAILLKNMNPYIFDEIFRSYGILKNARLLTGGEFYDMMSSLRLGISEKLIDIDIKTINELYQEVGAATICEKHGGELTSNERDFARAEAVRKALNEKI